MPMRPLPFALLPLILFAVCARADAAVAHVAGTPAAIETRAATAQEIKSFDDYYRALHPEAADAQPVFEIRRAPRVRAWTIAAHIDAAPQRSSAALCRMRRDSYDYSTAAAKAQRWSARSPEQQFVWLSAGASAACTPPTQPVELTQPLPEADIVSLLRQHPALMQRARLLLAGNTQCAGQRALPFHPIALGPGAPASGAGMYSLTFQSDRDSTVEVTVRKSGAELTAWAVGCRVH